MIITGISFIVFGAFTIIEGAAIGQVNRQSRIMQKHDERGVAKNEITEATAEPTEVKTEDEDHDKI